MTNQEFDYVDWEMVYEKLQDVPRLFQLWAIKQVMGVAGNMEWNKTVVRTCPTCTVARDMCAHVLFCCHEEWKCLDTHWISWKKGWKRHKLIPIF
jgi:hypothetical protein